MAFLNWWFGIDRNHNIFLKRWVSALQGQSWKWEMNPLFELYLHCHRRISEFYESRREKRPKFRPRTYQYRLADNQRLISMSFLDFQIFDWHITPNLVSLAYNMPHIEIMKIFWNFGLIFDLVTAILASMDIQFNFLTFFVPTKQKKFERLKKFWHFNP